MKTKSDIWKCYNDEFSIKFFLWIKCREVNCNGEKKNQSKIFQVAFEGSLKESAF